MIDSRHGWVTETRDLSKRIGDVAMPGPGSAAAYEERQAMNKVRGLPNVIQLVAGHTTRLYADDATQRRIGRYAGAIRSE